MAQLGIETQSIAQAFVEARRKGFALADYPGPRPQALSDAYAVQDAAIPLVGSSIAGWKVGRINSPWLEKLGVSRLSGPIFAPSVQAVANGHIPDGLIFRDGFGAAEAEFVFRIGIAPDDGMAEFSTDHAAALIDKVYCGVEIASSPYAAINADGPLVTISDFGNNGGLLLGPEIEGWRSSDFERWDISTLVDGAVVGCGQAIDFPGGLMESVRFLIENLVARGHPVRPGLLISSGAVTGVHEVSAGQSVKVQFGDHCTMRCGIRHLAA